MAQALAISKDILNQLRQLAVIADKDDDSFHKARERFESAGEKVAGSAAAFAMALYEFVLAYSDQPKLVDDKLAELNITTKRSTTVYGKIARLAFADVKNADGTPKLPQVSKYAELVGLAHSNNLSGAEFETYVSVSINHAMRKLMPSQAPGVTEKLKLGREFLARSNADSQVELRGVALPDGFADGDDVELLARVDGGKLILYGVVPKSYGSPAALLQRIGARQLTAKRKAGDLFAGIARTMKLITTPKDLRLNYGALQTKDGLSQFLASANGHVALFTLADDGTLDGLQTVMELPDWAKLTATISTFKGLPRNVSFQGSTLEIEVQLPDQQSMADYLAKKNKQIRIGRHEQSKLIFDISVQNGRPDKMPKLDAEAVWVANDAFGDMIENLKAGGWMVSDKDGVRFGLEELEGAVHVGKTSLKLLQAAVVKLRKLGPIKCLVDAPYLHLQCTAADGAKYQLALKLA